MSRLVRALLVEDQEDDALLLVRELKRGGFEVQYERVETNAALRAALARQTWDVIISDYSMPQFTALDALKALKDAELDIPFIIVSGTVGEDVAVAAMKAGAHDFMPKNNLRRFLPAIERELREAEGRRRRRQAERELQASLEMLGAVFGAAPLAMALLDPQGKVLRWNPAAERTFGWRADEVIGRELPFVNTPELTEFHERRLQRVSAGDVIAGEEIVHRSKDGAQLTVLLFSAPIRDAAGKLTSILDVWQDMTEQRGLEAQFRQAQKMEAIGRLAGGIAHDFNNVLTVIEGHASLALSDVPEHHALREDMQQILDAARRAASFTRQLLAFSRQQVIQPRVVDLNELTRDLSKMLKRAIGDHIMLDAQLYAQPMYVHADRSQLEQVLMNLVVNARDAITGSGTITLRTAPVHISPQQPRPLAPPGDYHMLQVSDTGHGIPQDVLAHMFEPFYTTKEPGKGTGLGLSTVYGIVTQNHGVIRVESEPGRGTTFTILLPQSRAQPETELAVEAAPLPARSQVRVPAVLVVEDEPAIRKLITRALERSGYRVQLAADAHAALEQIRNGNAFDVLLTDVMLPGMNGHDLAQEAQRLRPELQVVLMSGYAAEEVQGDLRYPYLEKPFSPSDLVRTLASTLGTTPHGSA